MIIRENSRDCIPKVIKALKKHEIVIARCDTIYGILGVPPHTCGKIGEIKGRDACQALLILISTPGEVSRFSPLPLPVELESYWPGALTVIFPGFGEGSSVALRCPDSPFLQRLLREGDLNLYSTSVNHHGEPPLGEIKRIMTEFGDDVDLIVDSGDLAGGVPSTIIDIRQKPYKLVRRGSVEIPEEWLV